MPDLQKPSGVVVLIHGLGRTALSMRPLSLFLNDQGFHTRLFSYRSRSQSIEQIVKQLAVLIKELCQTHTQIHFVTHSLGGIVLRAYLARFDHIPDFVGHSVMLAPPHQGSEIVDFWRSGKLRHVCFKMIMGDMALSLHTGQGSLPHSLSQLSQYSVAVIAGTRSIEWWFNPLFDQAHDGKVSVTRTHLGHHPHICIHATHTFIMNHPNVRALCVNFLQYGLFQD